MATQKKWKPGDVITLASGGPKMTVETSHMGVHKASSTAMELVSCRWFDANGTAHAGEFAAESLVAVPGTASP